MESFIQNSIAFVEAAAWLALVAFLLRSAIGLGKIKEPDTANYLRGIYEILQSWSIAGLAGLIVWLLNLLQG